MIHVGVARDKDKVKLLDASFLQVFLADGEIQVAGVHVMQYNMGKLNEKGGMSAIG